ncbi:agmatine deiminase [Halioglobus japonicus]|uniref:Putative agmatine deiminase n=1 Tax=Halioglobus japonicus TaxID=930805 RepID=A0AAP8MCM2_9GAMM|nr:agmatine deiminase [Halioglobus japonicus]AQA17372.1 agmatine deiminase [Halioglobus japonicus]PLW85295.1 agmatine deiminase [Halioglobus japonicus]GHD22495.1 putative agmatine deiminase [Halioglobus japonicus]
MSDTLASTPRADGFQMPGEHEPQQAVVMAWPERGDNWRNNAGPAQAAFAAIASAIAAETPVIMCTSAEGAAGARAMLPTDVSVLEIPCNDSWMRDIGPTYVRDDTGQVRGVDWQFNAWGGEVNGLYEDWSLDAALAAELLSVRGEARYSAPLVLEGGSIHVDGDGTCITTAECLLHPGRNPHLDQADIENLLREYLNVETFFWLPRGVVNDETDGHVDNILHIARPGEVLLSWCDDPQDPVYDICREALAVLEAKPDARGRKIKVHKLPLPGPLYMTDEEAAGIQPSSNMVREPGERLAGSYANFLITNQRVVFPLLDSATDEAARQLLQRVFPAHTLIGVPGREILLGGGNIHCITQQIPAS